MRRALQDTDFIVVGDSIIGVNLGYDICAEHECGIRPILKEFGLQLEKEFGFEARRNTRVPEDLFYHEDRTVALIYFPRLFCYYPNKRKGLESLLDRVPLLDEELAAAWDEESFAVHTTLEYKDAVRNLYKAFKKKKGVIALGSLRNHFSISGLMLLNYAKIPEEQKKEFREADQKRKEERRAGIPK